MKKTLSLFVMALFAVTMSAYDFEAVNGDEVTLYYNINEDGKTVTLVQGPQKYSTYYIVIPESVSNDGKSYTVTAIGTMAFQNCGPCEVHMPNSIVEIQNSAFNKCSLADITFSKNLKHIGRYAFESASFNSQSLYPVELPEGLETIGERAFKSTNLVRLKVPESVTTIDGWAFSYCASLVEISLPKNLKSLKECTFFNCGQLKTIVLPENLEYIGERAFSSSTGTGGLEEITFPTTLTEIGANAFGYTKLVRVVLPDNITKLGKEVFMSCTKLEEITFSKGMTEIPFRCVLNCSQLFKVTIPNTITKIDTWAFSDCTSLSSISLPESLTDVGSSVFYNTAITSTIKLPSKLTYIGEGMFSGCKYMTTFTIPNTIKEIKDGAFKHCENLSEIVIPESVTSIGKSAFAECYSLKEVTIPTSITSISEWCFSDCTGLQKVNFHDKLLSIGRYAFFHCENLDNVQFPKSIKEIIPDAFNSCTSLHNVTLPSSLERLGDGTFAGCPNVNKLHINRAIPPLVFILQGVKLFGVVEEGSDCVLYVPKGSKSSYVALAETQYKNFVDIVEEDVDGTVIYQIQGASTDGRGKILVNGQYLNNNGCEIEMKTDAVLTFEPNDGYRLKSLKVNDIDVTSQVKNNQYTIENVLQNYVIKVEFGENPVTLNVSTGNGGYVGISVEKHTVCECKIEIEDGWKINTVQFNGRDVTSEVVNGVYTTPSLSANATLIITFEQSTPTQVQTTENHSRMKAWATNEGVLYVQGLERGEKFDIFNSDGQLLSTHSSNGLQHQIPLQNHGVYIIRSTQKSVKVSY